MPATVTAYSQAKQLIRKYGLDGRTLKLALINSSYTFSAAHTQFSSVSPNEISGTGYTAGGKTLTGVAIDATGMVDAADVAWSAATITFRRAVLYIEGTLGGIVNPVLFSYLYDDTPADIVVNSTTFTHIWSASGIVS